MNHRWVEVRQLYNGTWLWECSVCRSESWTLTRESPCDGDLENSHTHKDCAKAAEIVCALGKTYGQPNVLPETAWARLAGKDFDDTP